MTNEPELDEPEMLAYDLREQAAEIERLREALGRVLEWWPENSENGRQDKGGSFGDDIRAARAALKGNSHDQ
jgi:hypothetical protein